MDFCACAEGFNVQIFIVPYFESTGTAESEKAEKIGYPMTFCSSLLLECRVFVTISSKSICTSILILFTVFINVDSYYIQNYIHFGKKEQRNFSA